MPVAPDGAEGANEPGSRYDTDREYTQDIGGNPLSEVLPAPAVRDPGGDARAATNRNILAAAGVPGAHFAAVAGPIKTGTLRGKKPYCHVTPRGLTKLATEIRP